MAEPAVTKVTLLAALAGLLGPLAAEYSLILAGALVGGLAGLSIRATPLPGLLRPLGHVLTGVGLALLSTPVGALVAARLLPEAWAISVDAMLPVVAIAIGAFWHPALAVWLPRLLGRRLGDGGGPGA